MTFSDYFAYNQSIELGRGDPSFYGLDTDPEPLRRRVLGGAESPQEATGTND